MEVVRIVKVYVDTREREKIYLLKTYLERNKKKLQHIEAVEPRTLPVSDICTSDGLVGIERKSRADFIGSLIQGKLKQQLYELRKNFTYCFLFVEGFNGLLDCISYYAPRFHPNVIIGATASALAHSKVPILYVGDFFVPITLTTIEKFYDGEEFTDKDYTPLRPKATVKDYKRYLVEGLPNVGKDKAEKILQHFNYSIKKLVNASEEELKKIPGVGDKTAKKIVEVLS